MKSKAYVKETIGDRAIVLIRRECACQNKESCSAKCFMGGEQIIETALKNEIKAKAGDFVEVEAKTSAILTYAAVVFILPIFCGLALYFIARLFTENIVLPYVASMAGFMLSVGFLYYFLNNIVKGRDDFRMTKILA